VKRTSLTFLLLLGCSSDPVTVGLTEPLRVRDGQFQEGSLPGLPPQTLEQILAEEPPIPPTFTSLDARPGPIEVGEERSLSGRTTSDAVAVAIGFPDLGSGYWVAPTQAADPTNNGELTWGLSFNINPSLSPGLHELLLAAVDAQGRSGNRRAVELCVEREVPDNGNVCDPTTPPPALVVSLSWDSDADLDLRVVTPGGKVVDGKAPSTAVRDADGNIDPTAPGIGQLDLDSNSNCVIDHRRRENLIFQQKPAPGTYLVYANLFDSCGHESVRFQASLHSAVDAEDGTFSVTESYSVAGGLIAAQANAGRKLGSFVTEFKVQ
jgi:hypothetical protein